MSNSYEFFCPYTITSVYFSDCTVVKIGHFTKYPNADVSKIGRKTVELKTVTAQVPDGLECPSRVNRNNWVNSDTIAPYEFRVTQNGNQVTVERMDTDSIELPNEAAFVFFELSIYCCPKGNN